MTAVQDSAMEFPASTPPVDLRLASGGSWAQAAVAGVTVWFRGYLPGSGNAQADAKAIARRLAGGPQEAGAWLRGVNGHFALVAVGGDWAFAAVDHVRSIPLFFAGDGDRTIVADHAPTLARGLGLGADRIDRDAARMFGLSNCLLGGETLYHGLRALQAGECVTYRAGREPEAERYYVFRPRPAAGDPATRRAGLKTLCLETLERLARSCAGREIVVPLSAGLDSRFVAAGLKHLGVRDVRCFAYGRPGNFEAAASEAIAEALGYSWTFVPTTAGTQRDLFTSALFAEFLHAADSFTALPFIQDVGPVAAIRESGFVSEDAVFVNGQSGDYLTGNHIPASLGEAGGGPELSAAARRKRITDALIDKHHALWRSLLTDQTRTWLEDLLWADIEAAGGALGDPADDFALYELSEWQNRQAKYVVGGQRTYDFFGHDWRLPLWEPALMDFFETAPLDAKYRQRLYREMLEAENWGGVWGADWRFPYRARPAGLALARGALKLACAPFGRKAWHHMERRCLNWHQDVLANYAIVPWSRVAFDRRGHRNAIAWHVESYLAAKGIGLDGVPLEAGA